LRTPILAVVGEAGDAERLAGAGELYAVRPLGYEAVLERMLDEGGEALGCIAGHHIGGLGLGSLPAGVRALADASRCKSDWRGRLRPAAASRRRCVPEAMRVVPPLERLLHLKRIPLL